jgi:hypothetical protein
MKVELSELEIWTLIEVLDFCAEAVEPQGDTDYIEELNDLEAKLRTVMQEDNE